MNTRNIIILLNSAIQMINKISEYTGRIVSWLILLMVLIIVYDVSLRYFWSLGFVGLQELQWHLFALVFLLGAGYTFKHDNHVRVDIFYRSRWMNVRHQAWVNLIGSLALLLPFCLLIIITSLPFVHEAWRSLEGSPDPGGLPYRFVLKASIPIGFILLMLQGIAESLTALLILLGYQPNSEG